ncbi:RagB/SusD family nutrient uptake outer membrane protein [Niabella insulamsoli]|uniref:RagB/SusD family protein n=1 Tax=Niabella insulamsoli TaxID=3144874 RepID=UPI0031FC0909
MKKKVTLPLLLSLCCMLMLTACSKLLDKTPTNELDIENAYQNVYDADAAVMGVYGKFMGLAERYIILNELRADLLDYTQNADKYLRQISNHTATADNPYADPRPFYEVIVNANDVLANLNNMYDSKKISQADYYERYADIACLRSFLYLQLGIHYGDEVRYVTNPLATLDDVNNTSLFPKLNFETLLDSLITFTEAIPFKEQYSGSSSLNITLDGYPTQKFFINKKCLLGDLYLWKGNYTQAASYYREVMETSTTGNQGESYYSKYKMGWFGEADNDGGRTISDLRVAFVNRNKAGDMANLLYNVGWRTMFDATYSASKFDFEWIWVLPFDNKFAPANPFIKLFSPIGGEYLVKPSQQVMSMWASQQMSSSDVAREGSPYDPRGLFSTTTIGGQRVASKFISKYLNWETNLPADVFVKNGDWYLFRQTQLMMRFAEAANRDGWHKLAYAFVSGGIGGIFNNPDNPGIVDKTEWQNTLSYPAPYNFDARNGEIPRYRSDWYRHTGVRSRAYLTPLEINATGPADSLIQLENGLLEETALENAFEGTRWADLLRIARRRNDPSILADKVYQKLLKDGDPNAGAARAKLMNKEGWYLPFKL